MMSIKGYISSKTVVYDPLGNKLIKLDIVEEREMPGPVVTGSDEIARIAREVVPLVHQLLRSMPITGLLFSGKVPIPRVTIWLSEDEIENLGKIDVGDYVEIRLSNGKIEIVKQEF